MTLRLVRVSKGNKYLKQDMIVHYSKPLGFVGRSLCYIIAVGNVRYGTIVGGSATKHLPGRNDFFGEFHLNTVINNIFFHCFKHEGKYPFRRFVPSVIEMFRQRVAKDWEERYKDKVIGFETLVELPRTGECYKMDGWKLVGKTKGFTCKRTGGDGTDSWGGQRVWNKDPDQLRPKLVFCKLNGT